MCVGNCYQPASFHVFGPGTESHTHTHKISEKLFFEPTKCCDRSIKPPIILAFSSAEKVFGSVLESDVLSSLCLPIKRP